MAERQFSPSRSYEFELKIKGTDYTPDMYAVKIASSVTSPYQVVIMSLHVDQNDIILDGVYGQDPCKLSVRLLEQQSEVVMPIEQVDFDLMVVQFDFPLASKDQLSEGKQKDRTPITITTVVRPVGKVGADISYDTDNMNEEKIEQIVIPPTTLYKTIQYLDKTFGLFADVPVYFCDHENKVHIMNISARLKKSQKLTITQLASGMDSKDIIEKTVDGINFYTYDQIETWYKGNATFATLAQKIKHVVKPKDTLSHTVEHTLDGISADHGLIHKNTKVPVDSNIAERETFYIGHTGYEYTEEFASSMMAKRIASLSTISINLEKNLPILPMISTGEVVKFVTKTSEFVDLSGKYILKSSELMFSRKGEWDSTAALYLIRTNKTI